MIKLVVKGVVLSACVVAFVGCSGGGEPIACDDAEVKKTFETQHTQKYQENMKKMSNDKKFDDITLNFSNYKTLSSESDKNICQVKITMGYIGNDAEMQKMYGGGGISLNVKFGASKLSDGKIEIEQIDR
ncbi:hypothetical protein DCO58_00225 [Helicobacter saguini]|uniref:Uncharacterized protein n=1 Tax=Helicobacter saguini TaxID=1548018 RepID=A0A347VQS3_9HELI|nr:hypothetical protein [Helicobacter saguini]MWV63181.1 hypothetical protein [Helicobacter saguini]MWV66149.1 hypothetical protein [Helicobacter saguini]MWV68498.1 hypothetical protein [Helicobacter saguini]MWV71947.1 hypothetical protein [Helicobacter saguini]TLD95956.1 hypothetical protein LS64_000930 [Helicobacter saguini]